MNFFLNIKIQLFFNLTFKELPCYQLNKTNFGYNQLNVGLPIDMSMLMFLNIGLGIKNGIVKI